MHKWNSAGGQVGISQIMKSGWIYDFYPCGPAQQIFACKLQVDFHNYEMRGHDPKSSPAITTRNEKNLLLHLTMNSKFMNICIL